MNLYNVKNWKHTHTIEREREREREINLIMCSCISESLNGESVCRSRMHLYQYSVLTEREYVDTTLN
jgi:hypothetical protein